MNIKQKLPFAALAGVTSGFLFFFGGVLDIFAGNRAELLFSFRDFGGYLALVALAVAICVTALLALTTGTFSRVLFGIIVWLTVMGYVQGAFLNIGSGSLMGDGTNSVYVNALAILNAVLWILTGAGCIIGAIAMKKHTIIRSIAVILLLMILGMQLAGCASEIGEIKKDPFDRTQSESQPTETAETPADTSLTQTEQTEPKESETEKQEDPLESKLSKAYLTTEGLYEVSAGKNIIIFVLDRFDVSYYQDMVDRDHDFFAPLRGFTYFGDNISAYSRTYPGITTMISGVNPDFSGTASDYFYKAYTTSPFLRDLRDNHYKIKLYTTDYYAYRDGTPLYGIASNLSVATDYTIEDRPALLGNLLLLSAYRYLPTILKPLVNVSSASFSGVVEYNGDAPLYELNDAAVYAGLRKQGLTLDDSENSYTLIHLGGCHDPYLMDEDGNPVTNGDAMAAVRGCFRMIYDYIDELKHLGVYENSTILITGDHPRARDDTADPKEPRLTALFVKEAGKSEEPLAYSDAQVSQENLIPTLVESAGLETGNAYGRSYFDIPAGEAVKRHHNFELYTKDGTVIIRDEVTGKGDDFSNWTVESRTNIGSLYE